MKVTVINNGKKLVEMKSNSSVADLLKKLGLNPAAFIVAVNRKACINSRALKDSDEVKIIPVVSGG